jgi:hypothetical protein
MRYGENIEVKILSGSQLGMSHPLQRTQRMGHPDVCLGMLSLAFVRSDCG